MEIKRAIAQLLDNVDLTREEAASVMDTIMSGEATPAQVAGFLVALRCKGETVEEITGCAEIMREKATRVHVNGPCIDTCGTGGDASGTFNISTAAAIVAAGAGAKIAKHGNRSVSSNSGSADVLRELGVNIDCDVPTVEKCIEEAGIGFLFAPLMHGAMKHAIGPRRELGVRTVFNILGPLTNPAGAESQLMGVFDARLCGTIAEVLRSLGTKRAIVVHSKDGLDEISVCAPTHVAELRDGKVTEKTITPEELGVGRGSMDELRVADARESAAAIRAIVDCEPGARREVTLANAGAALMCAGLCDSLAEGVKLAAKAVDTKKAKETLQTLVSVSNGTAEGV